MSKKKYIFISRELYLNFYQSPWWKHLRERKLKKQPFCEICRTRAMLQVHHVGYENIYKGRASAALKDTCVLCRECHGAVHQVQKERKLSAKHTKAIISELVQDARQAKDYRKELDINFWF